MLKATNRVQIVPRSGDDRIVLRQAPAASGAGFAAGEPATAVFWTKGEEALFSPPAAADTTCRLDTMD